MFVFNVKNLFLCLRNVLMNLLRPCDKSKSLDILRGRLKTRWFVVTFWFQCQMCYNKRLEGHSGPNDIIQTLQGMFGNRSKKHFKAICTL